MTTTDALIYIIGILVGILSFFLMRTMSKLDLTHDMATQNKLDTALLKQEHDLSHEHISEKLDDIKASIEEVKKEVKK
jgi:uncharacterized membrane-anchored protein YhcB (DUF1043 family)